MSEVRNFTTVDLKNKVCTENSLEIYYILHIQCGQRHFGVCPKSNLTYFKCNVMSFQQSEDIQLIQLSQKKENQ